MHQEIVKPSGLNFWSSEATDGSAPEVDIIAVQGLGANPDWTWVKKVPSPDAERSKRFWDKVLVGPERMDVYDIHRLVHSATRIWLHQKGLWIKTSEKAIQHIAKVFPSWGFKNRKMWRAYLPHTVQLLNIEQVKEDGRTREAVTLLEESYRWRKNELAENDPDRLTSQHALAGAYEANGQVKEVVELLKQVVDIDETKLAPDHPDRLASQHALAGAYQAKGQVKEAVELLKQVTDIEETTLAPDHPDRLASQHELAVAYRANGQVKEAIVLRG